MNRPAAANARGFTLLEMMTAVVVFSLIAAAIYSLLSGGRHVSERGAFHARVYQGGRAALRAIEADIRGAWSGSSSFDTGFKGTSSSGSDLPADTLEVVAFNNHPPLATDESSTEPAPRQHDLARVTWSVDLDPGTEAAGLVRSKKKLFGETSVTTQAGEDLETVAEDVVGLRFRYYDGSLWQDSWDSTVSLTVPKAVEITVHVRVEWKGVEETETFTTRVYLPIAATAPRKEAQQ